MAGLATAPPFLFHGVQDMPATNFPNGIRAPLLNASGEKVAAIAPLVDNSGGTESDNITAIGNTFDQDEVRDAIASLAFKINEIIAAQKAAQVTDT